MTCDQHAVLVLHKTPDVHFFGATANNLLQLDLAPPVVQSTLCGTDGTVWYSGIYVLFSIIKFSTKKVVPLARSRQIFHFLTLYASVGASRKVPP